MIEGRRRIRRSALVVSTPSSQACVVRRLAVSWPPLPVQKMTYDEQFLFVVK
jgi:hypothetical protein